MLKNTAEFKRMGYLLETVRGQMTVELPVHRLDLLSTLLLYSDLNRQTTVIPQSSLEFRQGAPHLFQFEVWNDSTDFFLLNIQKKYNSNYNKLVVSKGEKFLDITVCGKMRPSDLLSVHRICAFLLMKDNPLVETNSNLIHFENHVTRLNRRESVKFLNLIRVNDLTMESINSIVSPAVEIRQECQVITIISCWYRPDVISADVVLEQTLKIRGYDTVISETLPSYGVKQFNTVSEYRGISRIVLCRCGYSEVIPVQMVPESDIRESVQIMNSVGDKKYFDRSGSISIKNMFNINNRHLKPRFSITSDNFDGVDTLIINTVSRQNTHPQNQVGEIALRYGLKIVHFQNKSYIPKLNCSVFLNNFRLTLE